LQTLGATQARTPKDTAFVPPKISAENKAAEAAEPRKDSIVFLPKSGSGAYSALQHTAAYCNTLQRTATHCNTLQHAATHCNTLQHTATHCDTLQWCFYQKVRVERI